MSSHKSHHSAMKAIMNVLFTFVLAHAHGPPLAPTGITLVDNAGHGPVVRLTEGLAQQADNVVEWRFLCPSLWSGLPDAPLVSQTSSGALVHGLSDAFLLTEDGSSSATRQPEINALRVIDTTGAGANAFALIREEAQDALWRIEPTARLQGLPGRTTSLVEHKDTLLVTSLDGEGGVLLLTLNPADGSELERIVWPATSSAIPVGRSDGQRAWVLHKTEDTERIERWTKAQGESAAESESIISGPIGTGEHVLVGLNQTLHRLVDDAWIPVDGSIPLQCLAQTSEHLLACSDDKLLVVDVQGQEKDVFFDVQDLAPRALDRMAPDLASDCEVEWYRALADMGRSPIEPPTTDTAIETTDEGCKGCSSTQSGTLPYWLLLMCLLQRRQQAP